MSAREDASAAPPDFYEKREEKGRVMWLCKLTNASSATPPPSVRGGVLADDMGLGKTLVTLALIATSPPAGITFELAPAEPGAEAKPEADGAGGRTDEAEEEEEVGRAITVWYTGDGGDVAWTGVVVGADDDSLTVSFDGIRDGADDKVTREPSHHVAIAPCEACAIMKHAPCPSIAPFRESLGSIAGDGCLA